MSWPSCSVFCSRSPSGRHKPVLKNLLILRLAILNITAAALLVWAWQMGYVSQALAADTSGISYAIIALGIVGLISAFWRGYKVSGLLDDSKLCKSAAARWSLSRRVVKVPAKNAHLWQIAAWAATLGMFGTVVGLMEMAFSLRDMDISDMSSLGAALIAAFEGYGVALVTTAVGLVVGGWIEANSLFISTATECLIRDTSGER